MGLALGTMRLPAMLLIGMGAPIAGGTNILVSGLSAMSGAFRHLREGRVDRRIVLVMGAPAVAGAFIGGFGSDLVPESLLVFWQGVELIARGRILAPDQRDTGSGSGVHSQPRGGRGADRPLRGTAGRRGRPDPREHQAAALIRILRVDPRVAAGTNLFIGFFMAPSAGSGT